MTDEPIKVTDEQIETLRCESAEAGDFEQVALCDLATDNADRWQSEPDGAGSPRVSVWLAEHGYDPNAAETCRARARAACARVIALTSAR